MDKKELRDLMKKERAALSEEEIHKKSAEISARLHELPKIKNAQTIACYLAKENEVDLDQFIHDMVL